MMRGRIYMTIVISSNVKDPDRIKIRRSQIVDAAVHLFIAKGFHRTTTREIAKTSGLSNGALYEYVKSKEDILFLVCQHIHRKMRSKLEEILLDSSSGAVQLQRAIIGFFRVIQEMQNELLLIYQESKSLPPDFLHEVLREEEQIVKVFRDILQKGIQDGSLHMVDSAKDLFAQDIVVAGQMWAFRRWAIKTLSFEEFLKIQVDILLTACGVEPHLYQNV